eukprot:SAG31_NODE_25740_length_455_cov_0.896067_1_plen_145_part_01
MAAALATTTTLCSGSGSGTQLCRRIGPVATTTSRGWTEQRLKHFLEYVGSQGATTITLWSGLTDFKRPWNATFPAAVDTCPWFIPTLLEWVASSGGAALKADDVDTMLPCTVLVDPAKMALEDARNTARTLHLTSACPRVHVQLM